MASKSKTTVGQVMIDVREYAERAAIHKTLANFLRTRYLPRDSRSAQHRIDCEGKPVSEAVLEGVVADLEESAEEFSTHSRNLETQEVVT